MVALRVIVNLHYSSQIIQRQVINNDLADNYTNNLVSN